MGNKYDWFDVPEHINYIAMDSQGFVWAYREKPIAYAGMWNKGGCVYCISNGKIGSRKSNWRESLEERPK